MYQKYSIGTMANLLGVSAEAIRYYESKNIIRPQRDADTGYRYYNTWDLHMLLRVRYYQQFDLSLEEIATLLRSDTLGKVGDRLTLCEEQIEREIVRQANLLQRVRQSCRMLEDAQKSVGKYRIDRRPSLYRMNTQKNYTLFKEKEDLELVTQWAEKLPFCDSCALFYQEDVLRGKGDFEFGLCLEEQYASLLGVTASEKVQYYPACTCVHTCLPSRSSKYLSVESLADAMAYLKQNNLTLTGDVLTQVVCMTKPEGEYFNWHLVWLPIAPG